MQGVLDEEVAGLRKRLEEEQSLSDQQLDSLRAELRREMLSSDEYTSTIHENEQLHSKVRVENKQIHASILLDCRV